MKHVIIGWLFVNYSMFDMQSITIGGLERSCKYVIQNTSVYVEMTHRT